MRFISFLTVLGIALVFYLSWVPNPHMSLVWFLPKWISHWADVKQNENLRTAVPFVFLGVLVGTQLARFQRPWSWWALSVVGLTFVAVIAEVGQLLLPHRHFSLADILWGGAGSVVGLTGALMMLFINRQLRVKF